MTCPVATARKWSHGDWDLSPPDIKRMLLATALHHRQRRDICSGLDSSQHITHTTLLGLECTLLGRVYVSILLRKKLMVIKKLGLALGYPAGQQQIWDQNPDLWDSDGINRC